MAIVKKSKNNKCQEGRGERESSYTVGAATMENSREFLLLLFFFFVLLVNNRNLLLTVLEARDTISGQQYGQIRPFSELQTSLL